MKIKHALLFVIVFLSMILYTGCKRPTPHDFFIPDPNCGKMGFSGYQTHFNYGNGIFSSYATLASQKTITSISVGIRGSTQVYVMIYDGSTNGLIVSAGPVSVSQGWNKIPIADTVLPAGTYRLAVQVPYSTTKGIRMASGKGTMYLTGNSWGYVPPNLGGGSVVAYSGAWGMLMYATYCD